MVTCGALRGTRKGSARTVAGRACPGRSDAVRRADGAVPSTAHGTPPRAMHVCGCRVCEQTHPCMHPALCARQVQRGLHGTAVSVCVGRVGGGAGHAHAGGVVLRGHPAPTPTPPADHREFLWAGSPARAASLCRSAAPSVAWRAHKAPKREPLAARAHHTVVPRAQHCSAAQTHTACAVHLDQHTHGPPGHPALLANSVAPTPAYYRRWPN